MRKQTKIAAVVSAAALLAIGASMTSFAATGWQEENGTWVYYDRNENLVTGDWAKSGDNWFYLGDNGEMVRDAIIEHNDNIYYVDANGAMVTNRWIEVDNVSEGDDEASTVWYYFQNNGKAYKANNSGKTSFKSINGKNYAFDGDGKMLYGWVNEESGRETGDEAWKTATYYLGDSNDGARVSGAWKQLAVSDDGEDDPDQNYWFYFQNNGKKYKDTEKTINGKKYRFDVNGKMVSEWWSTPDEAASISVYKNYSSPEDGARKTKGWFKVVPSKFVNDGAYNDDSEKWFYADGKGNLYANGVKTVNGKKYLFNEKGEMETGLKWLKYSASGVYQGFEGVGDEAKVKEYASLERVTDAAHTTRGKQGLYKFSDDGDMQTGKHDISIDGDTYTFKFKASGSAKGVGVNGVEKNDGYYVNGRKIKADEDLVVGVYEVATGSNVIVKELKSDDLVARSYRRYKGQAQETTTPDPAKELNYTGSAKVINVSTLDNTNDRVVVLTTNGSIVKSGTRKDGNDVKLVTKGGYLVGAYISE